MRGPRLISLLIALGASPAVAQDPLPEVMLLLDSSSAMSGDVSVPGAYRALTCEAANRETPREDSYPRSRLMMAQDVLTGTTRFQHWCVEHDRAFREAEHRPIREDGDRSHYRAMCCDSFSGEICRGWRPCGNDHARSGASDDRARALIGRGLDDEGLIHRQRTRIKFGLMTMDTEPYHGSGADGHYSLGERLDVGGVVANVAGDGSPRDLVLDNDGNVVARGLRRINLGARRQSAPSGGLVPGSRGTLTNANQRIPEDEPEAVRQHSQYVMERVRSVVPFGHATTSAMLADLIGYYEGQQVNDNFNACRKRFAVLLTSGTEAQFYGGQRCANDAACGEGGVCVESATLELGNPCGGEGDCGARKVCLPHLDLGSFCGTRTNVCRYSAGYPYPPAAQAAGQLFQMGVPVFVVGLGVDEAQNAYAQAIARQGSPNLGERANAPGYFRARNAADVANALDRVVNAALAGLRSRARPLVLSPGPAELEFYDDQDRDDRVLQWRFTTFSEIPGSGDRARYGRVRNAERGCRQGEDQSRAVELAAIRFDDVLARRRGERRLTSRNPISRGVVALTGAEGSLFDEQARLRDNGDEAEARDLFRAPRGDGAGVDLLRVAARTLQGHFGDRGLPNGANGEPGERQLGEILDGDMVAIGPPNLAVRSPAYQAFQNEFGDRATLVAVGARDGLIHVFRAVDGREVMTFLPRLAWRKVREGSFQADGPLAARDIAECRSLGEGSQACPAEAAQVNFRTMLVGGTGAGGPNLFGIDVTRISDDFTELGEEEPEFVVADQFGDESDRPYAWNVTDRTVGDSTVQVEKLGPAVSRPVLTHVRENDEVKGAVIVGCGDDPERGNQELSNRPVAACWSSRRAPGGSSPRSATTR